MTLLAKNLKMTRKKLGLTQSALARLLDIGFRTYVRYETAKRAVPLKVLVKIAKFGNISLDRLLITTLTLENLEIIDSETKPSKAEKIDMIGGGLKEGKAMFIGLKHYYLFTNNKAEKTLLLAYRKLNNSKKKQCLVNLELNLNAQKKTKLKKNLNILEKT